MKKQANWIAAVTFVLGVVGVQTYAARLRAELQGGEPTAVVVVTRDLKKGSVLERDSLAEVEVPADYVDERRVLAKEKSEVLGSRVETEIKAGQGLVWSDVVKDAGPRNLAELIAPGKRAYQVDRKANPLGDLLESGDHVDVLLERAGDSEVLAEGVLVLSVGGRLPHDETGEAAAARNQGVTLSVSLEQAHDLLAAEGRGDLRLLLRHPDETTARPPLPRVEKTASPSTRQPKKQEIEHVR